MLCIHYDLSFILIQSLPVQMIDVVQEKKENDPLDEALIQMSTKLTISVQS